ncbi:MAG: putative porin [Verrucomicrobiota bacterium]|nr:putative porin [Verrucomicrobiota bacterium]
MKRNKRQNTATKTAFFAGAAALMALTPQTHAQSAVDNLLNKLEQKGILTTNEAEQLKTENEQETASEFNKAMSSRFPMPDWITSYKLYGDFRGRFDERTTPNPAQPDNIRLRYRLRAGLTINMKDNLQVGFRLGSADADTTSGVGGSPLSNNTTLRGNGTKKFLYVDAAYGKWTPIDDGTWMVAGTIGKMDNPFQETWMVFDPDYTPEGGALQARYQINDKNYLLLNAAGFVLAWSGSAAENISFLYGAQTIWNANWTDHLSSSLGVAAYDIVNRDLLTTTAADAGNVGNSVSANGAPLYNFNPVVVDASLTYKLDSFPLYPGAFPIKVLGEYMNNPAAPGSGAGVASGNQGFYAGILFGQAGKKGTWDIGYRYQSLDANAWYAQIVDDDNADYGGSFAGGTNVKGHLFTVDYALTDALLFSFHCYVNSMIGNTNPNGASADAIHAMADLMWKF